MHPLASTLVAMFSGASALAQPAAPSATQPPSPAAPGLISTVWDLTLKGGPVMIPIAICSLVALALVVERLLSLRRARVMPPEFVVGVRPALSRGQGAALEFCRSHPSPVARVLEAGIRRWDRPIEQVEKHITEAGLRETILLRKNFRGLVVITGVAPLLGLLGTIFGMITAFRTVAASADALGRTELLAAGIYEAMVTTAAGLIVAIPTLLTYHALAAKVDRLVFDIDAACIDLIEAHDQRASATPPAPAPSTIAPSTIAPSTTAPATTAPATTPAGVSAAASSASHMTHARPVADLAVVEAKEPEPAAA